MFGASKISGSFVQDANTGFLLWLHACSNLDSMFCSLVTWMLTTAESNGLPAWCVLCKPSVQNSIMIPLCHLILDAGNRILMQSDWCCWALLSLDTHTQSLLIVLIDVPISTLLKASCIMMILTSRCYTKNSHTSWKSKLYFTTLFLDYKSSVWPIVVICALLKTAFLARHFCYYLPRSTIFEMII